MGTEHSMKREQMVRGGCMPGLLEKQYRDEWAGVEGARERLVGSTLREGTRAT